MTEHDWQGLYEQAKATIADLRSTTADLQSQLEAAQLDAHVHSDHDVWVDEKHPEYFGCRTCLAAEGLEMQLEAAQREQAEAGDRWLNRLQAERTKREEAERLLSEALAVLKETLNYLPYPSGTSIVSKNQAQIRERVNNICQAQMDVSTKQEAGP